MFEISGRRAISAGALLACLWSAGAQAAPAVNYLFNGQLYWRNTAGAGPVWPTFLTGTFNGTVSLDLSAPVLAYHAGASTLADPQVVTYDASQASLTLTVQLLDGSQASRSLAISSLTALTVSGGQDSRSTLTLQGTIDPIAGISDFPIPISLDISRWRPLNAVGQPILLADVPLLGLGDLGDSELNGSATTVQLSAPGVTQAATGFILLPDVSNLVTAEGGGTAAALSALQTSLAGLQSTLNGKASQASVDALQVSVGNLAATLAAIQADLAKHKQ
jgi:hypothetical protein